MAGNNRKEIKTRTRSVENTQKVTRSMKLISTIKLKQFSKIIAASYRYTEQMLHLLEKSAAGVSGELPALSPLCQSVTTANKNCLILISSDRGLCGAYNTQIFKRFASYLSECQAAGQAVEIFVIGRKAIRFVKRFYPKCPVIASFANDDITDTRALVEQLVETFAQQQYKQIDLLYTRFVSSLQFQQVLYPLLPINTDTIENIISQRQISLKNAKQSKLAKVTSSKEDRSKPYILEPSPQKVFVHLLSLYLNNIVQIALQHSRASELANRVNAMSAATDNANKLIQELTLQYNKARQSAITQEISEIVVGVESMKG